MKAKLSLLVALLLLVSCTPKLEAPAETPIETPMETVAEAAVETPAESPAESQPEEVNKRVFVDDAGREVELPEKIEKVSPSGNPAQIVLFTLAPEKMLNWASKPKENVARYMDEKYSSLPEFGAFYSKNSNLNLEELLKANPDLIIDVGEKKKSIVEDLDKISADTGKPVIFVEAELETTANAYRRLGEVLGKEKEAEELAQFIEKTLAMAKEKKAAIEKPLRVYYGGGDKGLNTNPVGSIHASVLEAVGVVNVADIEITSGAGGNEVSMEQILLWEPDVLLFDPEVPVEELMEDPLWKELELPYYQVPSGPYNFLGRPPSINRFLGIHWLGHTLYPDQYTENLEEVMKEFYQLFYHYSLSDEEIHHFLSK